MIYLTLLLDLIGSLLLCADFWKSKKQVVQSSHLILGADTDEEQERLPHVQERLKEHRMATFGAGLLAVSAGLKLVMQMMSH